MDLGRYPSVVSKWFADFELTKDNVSVVLECQKINSECKTVEIDSIRQKICRVLDLAKFIESEGLLYQLVLSDECVSLYSRHALHTDSSNIVRLNVRDFSYSFIFVKTGELVQLKERTITESVF